jgi:hypothetical protein
MSHTPSTQPVTDLCPAWANLLITELRAMEVLLGNIPATDEWQTADMEALHRRLSGDTEDEAATEDRTAILFKKICVGLARENFEPQEISDFVNARIYYKGGPRYCNAKEVEEALHT